MRRATIARLLAECRIECPRVDPASLARVSITRDADVEIGVEHIRVAHHSTGPTLPGACTSSNSYLTETLLIAHDVLAAPSLPPTSACAASPLRET